MRVYRGSEGEGMRVSIEIDRLTQQTLLNIVGEHEGGPNVFTAEETLNFLVEHIVKPLLEEAKT